MGAELQKILFVYPAFGGISGGLGVTVHALETFVRAGHPIQLLTFEPPSVATLNSQFATSLAPTDFTVLRVHPIWRRLISGFPTPISLLENALIAVMARNVLTRCPDQLVVTTNGEMQLPSPGLQYIHYPHRYTARAEIDYKWYHRIPGAVPLYRHLCTAIAAPPGTDFRWNVSLTNSRFIQALCREHLHLESTVVYPPIQFSGRTADLPARDFRFIMPGRINPGKQILSVIDVLKAVRSRGFCVQLSICGAWDADPEFAGQLQRAISNEHWIKVKRDLSRRDLENEMGESHFGIHAMVGEHFGMVIAEMQNAGLTVFAHHSGGPREILESTPELLFHSPPDAVDRICRVLSSRGEIKRLNALSRTSAKRFSLEAFQHGLLEGLRRIPQALPSKK